MTSERTSKKKIFCVLGTRPEYIKMYPVYKALKKRAQEAEASEQLSISWVLSSQHSELLEDLENFFKIKADFKLDLSGLEQEKSLGIKAAKILEEATKLLKQEKPDLVIVQGDTLTTQQIALASYYERIPVAHIEAGLRTYDLSNPYPEELSRRIVSQIAALNFAPTQHSYDSLKEELDLYQSKSKLILSGNTGIDTLLDTYPDLDIPEIKTINNQELDTIEYINSLENKKLILVTAHRRENMGEIHKNLTEALYSSASSEEGVEILIAIHKNPDAQKPFLELNEKAQETGLKNIKICEAISYPAFVKLMQASYFIVTDSGGIQEEAPYLSKPVLVVREKTERTEAIDSGYAELIGPSTRSMQASIEALLKNSGKYQSMQADTADLYGNGSAAEIISQNILEYLSTLSTNQANSFSSNAFFSASKA